MLNATLLTPFRKFALAALIAVAAIGSPASARDRSYDPQPAQAEQEVTIGTTKLNDRLTMLSGVGGFSGGNVIVSNGPDGMLIIDDKIPEMTDKLKATLDGIGGLGTLKFVLNTHWHSDHTGANVVLGKSATIVAHTNVRKRLSSLQRIDTFGMDIPAQPASALPVITYDDSVSIHFNGEEIRLVHFPASHTDTDTVIYFTESNVLHTGDLFFNGIFPFVDIQNGGDIENLTKNVEKLMLIFPVDAAIVPGHGPLATMADLKTYHRMLVETTADVAEQIAADKSLDEIKAAGVAAEWQSWGWQFIGPDVWNAIIHGSLTK